MKSSSIIAIGGGIAAAIAIAVVLSMSGVSDSPKISESYLGEKSDTDVSLPEGKIQVLASFYPYYEFTKNVVGDSATVAQFMPSGVEAHDWEPRPQEIQSLKDADVFVYNGLGMEPYVDNMIDSGEFDNVLFVKVSEGVELIKISEEHDDSHAEEFAKEIKHVIKEFEHSHIDVTRALENIEEILHEHEGDGHDHGNNIIKKIEAVLHEIEDGHIRAEEGIEEIHHIILDIEEEHGTEEHGTEEHGTEEHGTEEHGTEEQGTEEHGTEEHLTEEQGKEEHGTEEPGKEQQRKEDDEMDDEGKEKQEHKEMNKKIEAK